MLEKSVNTADVHAQDIMTQTPATVSENALAMEALELLRLKDISQLVVMDGDAYAGFIHIHDLVKEGII
jgi:arabinose-5-phosphate isomerase